MGTQLYLALGLGLIMAKQMDMSSGLKEKCKQVGGNVLNIPAMFDLYAFILGSTFTIILPDTKAIL